LSAKLSDFYTAEQLKKLDEKYPDSFMVNDKNVYIQYSYYEPRPNAYDLAGRLGTYEAQINIPQSVLLSMNDSDIPDIGEDGNRPKLVFKTVFSYYQKTASSLAELKQQIQDILDKRALDEQRRVTTSYSYVDTSSKAETPTSHTPRVSPLSIPTPRDVFDDIPEEDAPKSNEGLASLGSLLDNATNGNGGIEDDSEEGEEDKKPPIIPEKTPRPEIKIEVMNDEIRSELNDQLTSVRLYLDIISRLAKGKTDQKITKLKDSSSSNKAEIGRLRHELEKEENVKSARGKVSALLQKSTRDLKESIRLLTGSKDLFDQFEPSFKVLEVLAGALEVDLTNDELGQKVQLEIALEIIERGKGLSKDRIEEILVEAL